jgi:YCII-related domain
MSLRWFVSLLLRRECVAGELRPERAAETRRHEMTRYLISFPSGAMDHIPDEESPAVGEAALAVVQEAWTQVCGCSAEGWPRTWIPSWSPVTGRITAGTYPQTKEINGGFTVLDVPSREAAVEWAAKIAAACRCAQKIREFMPDPAVGN